MKQILLSLFLHLFIGSVLLAQTGYSIRVNIKPFKNQYLYLGYHYGKRKALADSTLVDANSKGIFKGSKPLAGGIYFIVSPQKQILFELLLDKQQNFSITADTSDLPGSVKFIGTPDNALFQAYTLRINKAGREVAAAQQALATTGNPAEQKSLQQKIQRLNQQMTRYRDS